MVEGDRRGKGKKARADAGAKAMQRARAVTFERQKVLAGPKDRLDALAHRSEMRAAAGLVATPRARDRGRESGGTGLEVAPRVAPVADHDQMTMALDALEQREADLALADLGRRERERAPR